MEKTTVVYIIDVFDEMAGSERNLYEVVTRLDRERFTPVLVCLRGGRSAEEVRAAGVEVHDLDVRRIYSLDGVSKVLRLGRMLRRRNAGVAVTYHFGSDLLGGVAARLAGVPVVLSSRRDMGYPLRGRHRAVYRVANRLFDRIITVSEAVKKAVGDTQDALWHTMSTIYNGVDCGRFGRPASPEALAALRREFGITEGPVVGMLATIRRVKGHTYFLDAARRVAQVYPEARFLLVGWQPDGAYLSELKEKALRYGLGDRVIFPGGRDDSENVLQLFDVAVFSSLHEGFSNAVIEAMAAGLPVVATDGGGTGEAVVDGETGFLVPPEDGDALGGAVLRVLADRTAAAAMGRRGRERALSLFSMEGMMRRTEALYTELLTRKRRGETSAEGRKGCGGGQAVRRTVRHALCAGLHYSGLLGLYKRHLVEKNTVRILAYHRVVDGQVAIPGMSVSVSAFEHQMRFLRKFCSPVSLGEAVALLQANRELPPNAVAVTFDDGYMDNYTNAFPILERYGIPATVFLSVEAVDSRGSLWFDRVVESFTLTEKDSADLSVFGLGTVALATPEARVCAANRAVMTAKGYSAGQREVYIDGLRQALGVGAVPCGDAPGMMGWHHVSEMSRSCVTFGSHGMSHTIMTNLTSGEFEYEIAESKRIIREKTGLEATILAYPNGSKDDFSADMEALLEKHGYTAAVTLVKGHNGAGTNRYFLKRYCMSGGVGAGLSGTFSRIVFDASLSGLFASRSYRLGGALREKVIRMVTQKEAAGS